MEEKFDKEIDSLLRRLAKAEQSAFATGIESAHLDADEISAFAENALPEKARRRYVSHLADCGPCRVNLSSVITLNAESRTDIGGEQLTAQIPAPVLRWYQRLFAGSNLAYAMGALVLAFAGITFFTVWQGRTGIETAQLDSSKDLSKAPPANASVPAANLGTAANSAPDNDPVNSPERTSQDNVPGAPAGGDVLSDSKTQTESEPSDEPLREAPSDLKSPASAERRNEISSDRQPISEVGILSKDASKPEPEIAGPNKAPAPKIMPAPQEAKTGAEKEREKLTVRSADEEDKDDAGATGRSDSGRRIGGKTFRLADGVWYDSAYRDQPTTFVRRATPEYQALDKSLRSIAENLGGMVVVVWKQKAYRIQ